MPRSRAVIGGLGLAFLAAWWGLACVGARPRSAGRGDAGPERSRRVQLLFPPHQAILRRNTLDLICHARSGELKVDGHRQTWEPFEPPLRVAHVCLARGAHRLRIGSQPVDVYVTSRDNDSRAPAGWPTWRSHSIPTNAERCGTCHETSQQDGRTRVGPWKGHAACLACHSAVDFELKHAHPLEPLQPCQTCHAVHGSARKGLLKGEVKKVCAACHDT